MDMSTILMSGLVMGGVLGAFVGWAYFNTFRFVSLKRNLTRKNLGIVYFVTKGKALFPVIKDFDKDIIRTHKGIWFFRGGSIYRQADKEQPDSEIEHRAKTFGVKFHVKLTPDDIEFRQGCPVVFLDIDDMVPLRLKNELLDMEPDSRNPYQVEAVLGKEVAAAELEAIKMTKKNMQMLLILAIILVVVSVGISVMTMNKVDAVTGMVYNLTIRIP